MGARAKAGKKTQLLLVWGKTQLNNLEEKELISRLARKKKLNRRLARIKKLNKNFLPEPPPQIINLRTVS